MLMSPYDLQSIGALVVAVFFHGAGHVLAARATGVRFRRLRISDSGLRLVTDERGFPSYQNELITSLGGPLGNLFGTAIFLLLLRINPGLRSFCAAFVPLSLYLALLNLLPLRGFDGARVFFCLLCMSHRRLPSLTPDRADTLINAFTAILLFFLWICSVYLLLRAGTALSLYVFCLQIFRATRLDGT